MHASPKNISFADVLYRLMGILTTHTPPEGE